MIYGSQECAPPSEQAIMMPDSKPGELPEQASNPVHPQDAATPETQRDAGGPPPLIINPIANTPNPENNRQSNTPLWEKAAVLIAGGLLIVNIFLLCSTKKAADAAAKAAGIADATLKSTDKSNWRVQRAWLVVSANRTINFSGPVTMDIYLDNLGITEARKLDGFMAIKVVKKGEIPNLSEKGWKTGIAINLLVPKFHKTIQIGAYKGTTDTGRQPLLTTDIANGLKDGSVSLLIYGTLSYFDVWKIQHWTKFCDSLGAYNQSSPNPCADYTDTDQNEPK
jgi:hypothetical protein